MLVLIVVFIDGAQHLFLTIIDGNDGQIVKWCFVGSAPEDIAWFLQLPVAERNDDVRKLQTFRFVDGYQANTVDLVTLDGL